MFTLPGYQILAELYESRHSVAFRAKRMSDLLPVVIKALKDEFPPLRELTKYQNEFAIVSGLSACKGIARVLGMEKVHNQLALVVEDFGADSLRRILETRQFTLVETLQIGVGVASCLAEIHAAPESCWPGMVNRLIESDWSVVETTAAVKTLVAIRPPVGYESIYPVEHLQALHATGSDVTEIMRVGVRAIERARADIRDAQFAVEEHAAQFEAWLAEHGAWDDNAIAEQAQLLIKAQRALRHESEAKAAKLKRAITLSEWKTLTAAEREAATRVQNQKARLNRQDSDSIEWARWSWNPVTGCLHNCPYCYAREIADRFYPQKFEPSIAPEALSAPLNQAPPKEAADNVAYRNIFTCSMADMFGAWMPQEWIDAVLNIARQAKHWNFLMLTKFPQRLPKFEFPENAWVGVTVDCQARVAVTERAMRQVKAGVKWVSIEPLIEPITMDFSLFQWVVIGGASSTAQTPEWRPPRRWVIDLTCRAMEGGCMVYHKTNLNPERLRGYPGFDEKEPVSAPSPFHYLKGDVK